MVTWRSIATSLTDAMKELLEVLKRPLDSERFHQLLTFLFFNIAALVALILTGRLRFSVSSIVLTVIGLGLRQCDGMAVLNYPNWKWSHTRTPRSPNNTSDVKSLLRSSTRCNVILNQTPGCVT
jgi:hypothetical protein